MREITNINDEFLLMTCKSASLSAIDLLDQFDFNSYEWMLHVSGLSYGVWISLCDPTEISLDNVNDIINELALSNLN